MSAKPAGLDLTNSRGQRYEQDRRGSRDRQPPQVFVDLPERHFLGFGSCGPNTSISPAKTHANTNSRSLRRGDSRSPTRSTSYLTWSQTGGASYASPPPDRPYHIEPLTSSKLSNRKCTSPADHKVQRSIPPVYRPCIKTAFPGTQGAASRLSSKHGNATEAPGEESESRSATNERLKSREKSQTHLDTGIIELESAKIAQVIEDSGPDNTHPAEVAMHDGPESVLPSRTQAACRLLGHGPRREPQAYDMRPLPAHMPTISPHQDPLDAILEALLKDCNSNVARSGSVSRAISSHRNVHASEEAGIPDRIQEYRRMPAHDFINIVYDTEAQPSASNASRKPRSASLQQVSAIEGPRSTHTHSTGSLYYSNRPNSGYFQGYSNMPMQSQTDSRNAWNDYDDIYQRQQKQADLTPDSGEHIPSYAVVRDGLSGPLRETNHAIVPDEHAQTFHPVELGDNFDYSRPYLCQTLREGHENGDYQEITHSECHDQSVDNWNSHNFDASFLNESHKGRYYGIMAESNADDYQEKDMNADREQSFAQGADQHEVGHQLFTTNTTGTHPALRPHYIFNRNHDLKRGPTNAQVLDVEPALSGFWTPHKLY